MAPADKTASVLTVRIDADLTQSLAREARRRHTSKSELVRELLTQGLGGGRDKLDREQEARRQSLLVSDRPSEAEALTFLEEVADTRGWR